MNEENILVITDREELYDKCENMEQLFDKYYLPLLDKHYSKTYKLRQENTRLKNKIRDIEKILKSNRNVDHIYCALSQYLNIFDYELDLKDYLKEN